MDKQFWLMGSRSSFCPFGLDVWDGIKMELQMMLGSDGGFDGVCWVFVNKFNVGG